MQLGVVRQGRGSERWLVCTTVAQAREWRSHDARLSRQQRSQPVAGQNGQLSAMQFRRGGALSLLASADGFSLTSHVFSSLLRSRVMYVRSHGHWRAVAVQEMRCESSVE